MAKLFKAQEPTIQKICDSVGIWGGSVGILHYGEVVYKYLFNFQDVKEEIKSNDDTLYGLGSVSKSLVAAGVAEEGKLKWTTTAKEVIPEFEGATDNHT